MQNVSTLSPCLEPAVVEAGCDEAGRGCLAGPVYAAAVILPDGYSNPRLNDSKKLTARQRDTLRAEIERDAVAWAVATCSPEEIDQMNILAASIEAMQRAVAQLAVRPEALLIDGNRFKPYTDAIGTIPHTTIVGGDAKMMSIAAASILAKTHRDEYMLQQAPLYPEYGWQQNKGYPTRAHRQAIADHGATPLHRMTFTLL